MRFRKLRIAWSVFCGLACVLLVGLWVRSYWQFDQFIHAVSATEYFAWTSIEGEIQIGMSDDPHLRAAFPPHEWIRNQFPLSDWQKALDGPEVFYPASSPGPFIAPTIRMPNFTRRSWLTSSPSDRAYQIVVPYWLIFLCMLLVGAGAWRSWRFRLRTLLLGTTLVAVVLGLVVYAAGK